MAGDGKLVQRGVGTMGKTEDGPTYHEALEALFQTIDDAPLAPAHSVFKTKDDKEHIETLLMFSYRKRQAARHHVDSVEAMVKKSEAASRKAAKVGAAKLRATAGKTTAATMSKSWSTHAYIHELSAFLEAIRSGLDFLTKAASRTIPGVKAHSIHTLENMVDKGQASPVLDVVKAHGTWLKELREYRDEVVHRSLVQAPAEGWQVSAKGVVTTVIVPVVVPRKTLKDVRDTRRSGMMEGNLPDGLDRSEWHSKVTMDDGSVKVLRHEIRYTPSKGYVGIVKFMKEHAEAYRQFSVDLFVVLAGIGFDITKAAPTAQSTG